jgi:hypothetical protein
MTPSRILPDLQSALLCEDIRQEINGNLILLGVMRLLRVPQLPVTATKLCIYTTWTAGLGDFQECVRLIAPDQTTVLREAKTKFVLQDPAHNAINVSVMGGVEFKADGVYFIEVLVDEVMKLRFPVPVVVVQPPQGAQEKQTPPDAPKDNV